MAKAYVTSEGLNLRASPSKDGRIVDQLGYHDELEVLTGGKGKWIKVRHVKRGKIGYVYNDYVMVEVAKPAPKPPVPAPAPYDYSALWIAGGLLVAGLAALFLGGWL